MRGIVDNMHNKSRAAPYKQTSHPHHCSMRVRAVVGIFTTCSALPGAHRPWLPTLPAGHQPADGLNYVYVVGPGPCTGAIALGWPEGMNNGKSFAWLRTAPALFPTASHFFKMDVDTAICPPTLARGLQRLLAGNPDYVGRKHTHTSCGGYAHCPPKTNASWSYMSGAFYGVSIRAARCLGDVYTGSITGFEDLMVGKALYAACNVTAQTLPCLCQADEPPCPRGCPLHHMQHRKAAAGASLCARV